MRLTAGHGWDVATTAFGRWPPAVVLWLAGGSLTAIFAIFALILYASWLEVGTAAWTASSNLGAAISQDIDREFELLKLSLLELRDGASQPEVMALPAGTRQAVLFDRAASAHGLGALLLLDALGRVVEQAGTLAPTPIDLSGEPFFTVQRDRSDAGLFVSHPFISLTDGEASIALSRRVERRGVFVGVAVATIKLSYFQTLFSRLDLGLQGSISLMLTDGTLISRKPFAQAMSERALPVGQSLAKIGTRTSGMFDEVSTVDGVRRQYFYDRIGTLPLIQFVGRSIDDVYAAWWRRTALTVLAMLLLGNTMLLLVIVLHVELKRRRAAEAELAVLAATDKLTGLANRRTFDDGLQAVWGEACTRSLPVSLLLIDIDHFKALNDAIGHQGGDAVLALVGNCLAGHAAGPGVLAARYGGEEFVVLMLGTGRDAAVACAETLRRRIEALNQTHPQSPAGRLTVSLGIATAIPSDAFSAEDLIRAADRALYRAKRTGRNKAVAAEGVARAA